MSEHVPGGEKKTNKYGPHNSWEKRNSTIRKNGLSRVLQPNRENWINEKWCRTGQDKEKRK